MEKKIINKEFGLYSGDNIVVKVGSNILAGETDGVNLVNIENIVSGIDYLMEIGLNVFLVSSGAVAVGKSILEKDGKIFDKKLTIDQKAFCASVGQPRLLEFYSGIIKYKKNINGYSQNLVNHNTFRNNESLKNIKEIWKQNIENRVLAIINENDAVSREELKFSDNDELSGLVAEAINAKVLVLLSDIDGIYKNYKKYNEELIKDAYLENILDLRKEIVENDDNSVGKGGGHSKLNVMSKMQKKGIIGILAHGGRKNIIQKIFDGENCKKTIFRV